MEQSARGQLHGAFKPLRVDLVQPRPDHEEACRRLYRCRVRFDAGCNWLTFESHWLGARMPGNDRITCGLVQAQLNTLLAKPVGRHDLVESVANRMRFGIEARHSQRDLAQIVNVSDRVWEGTSPPTVSCAMARYASARDLLANSDMTAAEVAELVGYSDTCAFRRAFKRWAGVLAAAFLGSRG